MGVRIAVTAIILAVAATGCSGDDPSPTTAPTAPPSTATSAPPATPATTTPAPSPTPTPPPQPALSRQDSPAGAESFARYWLAALDYAYTTGDTRPFRGLGNCTGCTKLSESIDKLYSQGGQVEGGRLKVVETRVNKHVTRSAAAVELFYSRSKRIVTDGSGERFTDTASPRLGFLLILQWVKDQWQLERFPVLGN